MGIARYAPTWGVRQAGNEEIHSLFASPPLHGIFRMVSDLLLFGNMCSIGEAAHTGQVDDISYSFFFNTIFIFSGIGSICKL